MNAQFYGPTGELMLEAVVSEATTADDLVLAFTSGRWRGVLGGVLHVSPTGIWRHEQMPSDEQPPVDQVAASDEQNEAECDGTA